MQRYTSIFDLVKRIDLRAANKKAFENLALAGGFDSFLMYHRSQYFNPDGEGITFLRKSHAIWRKISRKFKFISDQSFWKKSDELIKSLKFHTVSHGKI